MAKSIEEIAYLFQQLRRKYSERDARWADVLEVRKGNINRVFPGLFPECDHPEIRRQGIHRRTPPCHETTLPGIRRPAQRRDPLHPHQSEGRRGEVHQLLHQRPFRHHRWHHLCVCLCRTIHPLEHPGGLPGRHPGIIRTHQPVE